MSILGVESFLESLALVWNGICVLDKAGACCDCCHYGGEREGTAAQLQPASE